MGRGSDWDSVTESLRGFDCYCPDLPGHGENTCLSSDAYSMDAASDWLIEELDKSNVESACVVGYSMGGRLALHIAIRHPKRVRGLVLVSASPGLRTEVERSHRRELDSNRIQAMQKDFRSFLEEWYRMPLFSTLDKEMRRGLVARRLMNDTRELEKSMAGMGTGVQASHWEHLHALCVPAWIIVGERDDKYLAISDKMSESDVFQPIIIPGASHAIPAEKPAYLAALLEDLLSTLN